MQTSTDSEIRRVLSQAWTAEGALEENPTETGGEEIAGRGSALLGMRVAFPLALGFWGLVAALIWAFRA